MSEAAAPSPERVEALARIWFEEILKEYPPDARQDLARQMDPCANPVGATFRDGLRSLLKAILNGEEPRNQPFLGEMVRIRAVQDFIPSRALSFLTALKEILQREREQTQGPSWEEDRRKSDRCIDQWTLCAFDLYMACKERLAEIKLREARDRVLHHLERINARHETPDRHPEKPGSTTIVGMEP